MRIKVRGANFLRKKLSNTHPKDIIQTHRLFKGDLVQVVTGKRDFGKQGKVLDIIKDKNLIVVEGIGMAVKHLKPNPFYPKGGKIQKETPIHYSRVQLVDPTVNQPVKVQLEWTSNPEKRKKEITRYSKETRNFIPVPEAEDPLKNQDEGPLDTKVDDVMRVTFKPDIKKCVFPASLMNELERMERKNKTASAI